MSDVPTVRTIATALPISPIMGLPSATRPLTIHRGGPGHQWAILTTSGISHEPAPGSCSAPNPPSPLPRPGTSLLRPPNPGTVSSSAPEPTPPCAPPTGDPLCRPSCTPHRPYPERRRSGAAGAGHSKCIVLVLWLAVCVVIWAHSGGHGAALGKDRLGLRRRGARAHRRGHVVV
jgi:hypothetical protein